MKSNVKVLIILGGILIILLVLFLQMEYLIHELEKDIARNPGNDEQSRMIRNEADEYITANKKHQFGIVAVGGVVISVAAALWIGQPRKRP